MNKEKDALQSQLSLLRHNEQNKVNGGTQTQSWLLDDDTSGNDYTGDDLKHDNNEHVVQHGKGHKNHHGGKHHSKGRGDNQKPIDSHVSELDSASQSAALSSLQQEFDLLSSRYSSLESTLREKDKAIKAIQDKEKEVIENADKYNALQRQYDNILAINNDINSKYKDSLHAIHSLKEEIVLNKSKISTYHELQNSQQILFASHNKLQQEY